MKCPRCSWKDFYWSKDAQCMICNEQSPLLFSHVIAEEVGQLIRRIWANLSTNQIAPFSSCSHEAFGIENLHRAHKYRLFSYCYAHFFGNFTRYYFYNSESTHWNGILKGKRYFPVYFDLSL